MFDKHIKTNYVYSLLSEAIATVIAFFSVSYIARTLGVVQNGFYTYAAAIVFYFGLFARLGNEVYGNRLIAQCRDDPEEMHRNFTSLFCLQLLLTAATTLLYLLFVHFFILEEEKVVYLCFVIQVTANSLFLVWFFKGVEDFRSVALVTVCCKVVSFAAILVFVKTSEHFLRYVLIESVAQLIANIVYFVLLRPYKLFARVGIGDIFRHLKPSLVLLIPILSQTVYRTMDKVMLGALSSKSQVGIYTAAELLYTCMLWIPIALSGVVLPRLSNMIAKGLEKESGQLTEKIMHISMFLAAAIAFGIAAIATEFIPLYYGDAYRASTNILLILAPGILFITWANIIRTNYLIAVGRDYGYVITICIGAAINLILNFLLIPQYHATGAAVGTLLAEGSIPLTQMIFLRGIVPWRRLLAQNLPFLFIGGAMLVCVRRAALYLQGGIAGLFWEISIGAAVYLALSALIWFVKKRIT